MPFKKGISGNPAGRPAGTENKINSQIREAYKNLIEDNLLNVEDWLKEISKDNPDKALNFIIKLSEFVLPKLQSTNLSSTTDFENLTDQDLDKLINKINGLD